MNRILLTLFVAAFCSTALLHAQKDVAPKEAIGSKPTLKVGDAAPGWTVTKWLNGSEVKGYEPGKVYVVEFWATWCGPCIAAMPHLADLSETYKDQGLVVIGMTTKDTNNTQEAVAKFVEENAAKFKYVFAYCEKDDTDTAFMKAAKQEGIPCSFVVGKDQKIAFIGHPMELDDVLPRVIDGTWKGQADIDALAKRNKELDDILETAGKSPTDAITKLIAFGKTYPEKIASDDIQGQLLSLNLLAGKLDAAATIGEALLAKSVKKKTAIPALYVLAIADKAKNPEHQHAGLVEKAIAHAIAVEPKDIRMHLAATDAYKNLGNQAKAVETGALAVKIAPNDKVRKQVQNIVDEILSDKK